MAIRWKGGKKNNGRKIGFVIDYRTAENNRKQVFFNDISEKTAKKIEADIRLKEKLIKLGIKTRTELGVNSFNLDRGFKDFINMQKNRKKREITTVDRYKYVLNNFSNYFGKEMPVKSIKKYHLKKYEDKRIEVDKIARETLKTEGRHLRRTFRWFYNEDKINENPFDKFESDYCSKYQLRFDSLISYKELIEILLTALQSDFEAFELILAYLSTGLRTSEILTPNLEWEGVLWDYKEIMCFTKTSDSNRAKIRVAQIMIDILKRRKTISKKYPFQFNRHRIYRKLTKVFRSAGFLKLTVQDLRKIAGAYVYLESGDIYKASKFLNHSSVMVTEKYYINIPNPNPKKGKLNMDAIFKASSPIINNFGTKSYQKSVNKLKILLDYSNSKGVI